MPSVLHVLLDRLRNEITRLTAVRAFGTIAASPLHIDLAGAAGVLEPVTVELTSFMRKALRPLRQAALATMQVCVFGWSFMCGCVSVGSCVGVRVLNL